MYMSRCRKHPKHCKAKCECNGGWCRRSEKQRTERAEKIREYIHKEADNYQWPKQLSTFHLGLSVLELPTVKVSHTHKSRKSLSLRSLHTQREEEWPQKEWCSSEQFATLPVLGMSTCRSLSSHGASSSQAWQVTPLTEKTRLKISGSPDRPVSSATLLNDGEFRSLPWKTVWNFGDSRESYRDSRSKVTGTPVQTCWNFGSRNYLKSTLLRLWIHTGTHISHTQTGTVRPLSIQFPVLHIDLH